jgi:hypothetical protein
VRSERLQFSRQRLAYGHRERRGDADVMQHAFVIVQPEEQRTDGIGDTLVPAKTGDDAVGRPRVLDLEHRALPRLIGCDFGLGDDAIESRALESFEPFSGNAPVARHGRQVDGRANAG